MKILYAVHGYKPAYRIGGPILSVSALAERLVQRGHHVDVVTSNANVGETIDVPIDQPVDVAGVKVWYFRSENVFRRFLPKFSYMSQSIGFLYSPAMRPRLNRLAAEADLVHTHMPFIYPSYAAAHAAFRHRKPLFYHQRGVFDPERLKFRSLKKSVYLSVVEKPIMRKATTLVALTDAELQNYRRLGIQTRCRVVPNGIDTEKYRTESTGRETRSGVPRSGAVILFLSRIHPTKGADRLLQAFLRVHSDIPDSTLVIAGPDEFGMESQYRDMIRAAGLEDRVLFPGMVSGEEKLDLLARADLFCLPSDAEGFSMAVLEALASGTAVCLSYGCHFDEVEKSGCGRVISNDIGEIARTLREILTDRPRLKEMGRNALEFVRQNYDWDHITDEIVDIYREGITAG
jgi:glycosyltransferase involved in cell wall biosynthesis